ncbi:hypothetical protein ciss_03080 [Carboxydothermus islandicus]|uniref:HD-GYP domain-containing protein n=2 Tax=Carboxydothermus islandicus TaxID=661089 RepID=A0A1L8CZL0_9THEO|nr:hypothetical protein ciss_03080 [Carboxydothermus islandicus]
MKVAYPIIDGYGRVLINTGVVLTPGYIERLRKLRYQTIYIVNSKYKDLNSTPTVSFQLRQRALDTLGKAFSITSETFPGNVLTIVNEVKDIAQEIVLELAEKKNLLIDILDIRNTDNYTLFHSLNIAILAAAVGIELAMTNDKLVDLVAGALLHDIGKVKIPPEILNKPGPLDDDEWTIMKKHPLLGVELIGGRADINPEALYPILQHHEKDHGNGYPQRIPGNYIHPYAKITAVCDIYDAMTSNRVYKPAYPPQEVFEYISSLGGNELDYKTVQIFTRIIAAYPVGTMVRLSTGEAGYVIKNYKGLPARPLVLVTHVNNRKVTPYEADLARNLDVVITGPVSEIDLIKENLAEFV